MGQTSYHSSSSSATSTHSSYTRSTATTNYADIVTEKPPTKDSYHEVAADPRASVLTYASTHASDEAIACISNLHSPSERRTVYRSDAVPSTPVEFAELFPSTRELLIHHDDSTDDGNMNLRVDTEAVTTKGHRLKMSLFHLRISSLEERRFSLRRYCRDSGREVCHTSRKYTKSVSSQHGPRPSMTRSLRSALHNIGKRASVTPHLEDSGYESDDNDAEIEQDLREFTALSGVKATIPTNAVRLEFSNYAQVELHRCALRSGKGHLFEYWGTPYQWQCERKKRGTYHLVDLAGRRTIAQIVPKHLSRREALEEELQGSWVPPCSLRITDHAVANTSRTDIGDVIVATGLMSMVDDCIKRRWPTTLPYQRKRTVTSDQISQRSHSYTGIKR